ncbi:MAG: LuxR C-terminal-related transcriptional regulator [Salibacteraceae bacterium]
MPEKKITIGLVEDRELVRTGVRSLINEWPEFEFIFESNQAFSAIKELRKQNRPSPDVLLSDLYIPNNGEQAYQGFELCLDLEKELPDIKVLIFSVDDSPAVQHKAIEMGARGFLPKSCSPAELRNALIQISEVGAYVNEDSLKALQKRLRSSATRKGKPQKGTELSNREIEVLQLICQQLSAEEIGAKLFISAKTVNGHRNNLLQKTGARNITGLVMYAVHHGYVESLKYNPNFHS